RGDVAAPAGAGPAEAVSDVALSHAESRRSAGMDLHFRHDAAHGGRVWTGSAAARCRVLRCLVVERTNLALRGARSGGIALMTSLSGRPDRRGAEPPVRGNAEPDEERQHQELRDSKRRLG